MNQSVACRCMDSAIRGDGYPGFLYFIQMDRIGPIKVGYAKRPSKRIRNIQSGNPYSFRVLYITPGSPCDEEHIHNTLRRKYPELCIRGEWYHPGKPIIDTIEDFKGFDQKDSEWERGFCDWPKEHGTG